MRDVYAFERSSIHEFEENLNFAAEIEHVVASDDVWIVDVAENLDLAVDLEADGVFGVAVDDFQGVGFAGVAVEDFVDGAAASGPDSADSLQLGEVDGGVAAAGGGGGGGSAGREREGDGEGGVALREGEGQIGPAAGAVVPGGGGRWLNWAHD